MLSGGFRCLNINNEKKLKVTLQFDNFNLDMAALLSWKLDRVPYFTSRKLEQIASSVLFGTVHL